MVLVGPYAFDRRRRFLVRPGHLQNTLWQAATLTALLAELESLGLSVSVSVSVALCRSRQVPAMSKRSVESLCLSLALSTLPLLLSRSPL